MNSRRSFHRDLKLGICQEVEAGLRSKAQICRDMGLSPSVLDRWMEQYRSRGASAFPNSDGQEQVSQERRMKELEALVGRQALEIEFLKAAIQKGAELREKKPR